MQDNTLIKIALGTVALSFVMLVIMVVGLGVRGDRLEKELNEIKSQMNRVDNNTTTILHGENK